jgi:fumarate reductase subunit C
VHALKPITAILAIEKMITSSAKRDLKAKLGDMSSNDLLRWVSWVIVFAAGVLATVFGGYLIFFGKKGVSDDPAVWGQFGDFVGGTANPVLSFLTLITLALTIILQSRQLSISSRELELSRNELELTRDELRRSAQAQELSEKALRAQAEAADRSARLSGINFLLGHCKSELRDMKGIAYMSNDPRLVRMNELFEKERVLLAMLDAMFDELTHERNGHE